MQVLVTAGNTQTPIDRVRCVTNIFTGRTGARLALEAYDRGHAVTLLTSHPNVIGELRPSFTPDVSRWKIRTYRTFDDLHAAMAVTIPGGVFDAIIHSAAVSDYALTGVFAPTEDGKLGELPRVAAGKVSSSHPEIWLRMVPTPKLIDLIRKPWGFNGTLVKFKLEVGVTDEELAAIARKSRHQSAADFLVANTLDAYETRAIICDREDAIQPVERSALPELLWQRIDRKAQQSNPV